MWISRTFHIAALAGFVGFGALVPLGVAYQLGVGLGAMLLIWQHRVLRPDDLSRIQAAFFTANGTIALVMLFAGSLDLYVFVN